MFVDMIYLDYPPLDVLFERVRILGCPLSLTNLVQEFLFLVILLEFSSDDCTIIMIMMMFQS